MNSFGKIFGSSLGRDFWKFRLGQMVSLLGGSCSSIALSWWILEKTGSAKAMAAVLAPAMVVNLIFLPLFGPLGDNLSRKKLIVIADLGRFVLTGVLAGMVYFDYFNLRLLAGLYIVISLGSALFGAVEGSILPQIVNKKDFQTASQQSQAIMSFGGVVGGIAGGVVVSVLGIFGAFLADAGSFLVAGLSSSLIKANTVPKRKKNGKATSLKSLSHWKKELLDGFRILFKIRVLFWIGVTAMLINFALAPLSVVLPVFAKLGKNMPAWYLGGLESSIALGAIVGALSLGLLQKYMKHRLILISSLEMIGISVLLMPWSPSLLLPLLMMFLLGLGSSWANIQINTQITLTLPDSHRARVSSVVEFFCGGISPLGVAAVSLLIAQVGLTLSLLWMGLLVVALAPLLFFIPKLSDLLEVSASKAGGFYQKHYPGSFV